MLLGQGGMPGCAVLWPGMAAVTSDAPGVASSQGRPHELPFLVWRRRTVRVEGTAFRISSGFGGRLFICARWPGAQSKPGKWQPASGCIPVGSGRIGVMGGAACLFKSILGVH